MPRMFIETIFVIIFLSFFVIKSDNQNLVQDNLSEIILLGVLVVRSLPSVNRLLRALQTLAYSKNILADFMREVVQDKHISDWQAGANEFEVDTKSLQAVRLSNIQAGYGDDLAIHISDLELVRGRWYGLVGESGTGKHTAKGFLGQMQPNSGEIRVYRDGFEEVLKGCIIGLMLRSLAKTTRLLKAIWQIMFVLTFSLVKDGQAVKTLS